MIINTGGRTDTEEIEPGVTGIEESMETLIGLSEIVGNQPSSLCLHADIPT